MSILDWFVERTISKRRREELYQLGYQSGVLETAREVLMKPGATAEEKIFMINKILELYEKDYKPNAKEECLARINKDTQRKEWEEAKARRSQRKGTQ